jgi:hypothetical protein
MHKRRPAVSIRAAIDSGPVAQHLLAFPAGMPFLPVLSELPRMMRFKQAAPP